MTTGIHTIVDQLLGGARIPASAEPITQPWEPKPKPKPAKPKPPGPHARLLAALDSEWRSVRDLWHRARVSEAFAYAYLREMVAAGMAEERAVPWAKGLRREYRRQG